MLRRAWDDRQGVGTPSGQHVDQPELNEIAGKPDHVTNAGDGPVDRRPK